MSDTLPPGASGAGGEPAPASSPEPTPEPVAAPSKPTWKRRWSRRVLVTCGILFMLVVGIRIAVWIALPMVIRQAARTYDLEADWEELNLTLLGADAELWHLTFKPKDGGEVIFDAEYCRADFVIWQLFRGKIVVRRLEADGVDVDIERAPDGSLVGFQKLIFWTGPRYLSVEKKPTQKTGEEPRMDLSPPVILDALRLQHVDARIRDNTVTPPFDTRMKLSLRLSNLGSETRPLRFGITVSSAPILDSFDMEGEATAKAQELSARVDVRMEGLHLRPLAAYLEPFGVRAASESMSFRASGTLKAGAAAPPEENAVRGELLLEKIEAHSDGEEILALDRLSLVADSIGPRHARFGALSFENPRARARRVESGVRVAGLEIGGLPSAKAPPVAPPPAPAPPPVPAPAEGQAAPAVAADQNEPPPPPFRVSIAEVRAKGGGIWFRDDVVEPPAALALELGEFSLKNIVLDPSAPEAAIEIATSLGAPGLASSIRVTGRAVPFAPKKTLELLFAADGAQLSAMAPYLALAGLEPDLENGKLGAKLEAGLTVEGGAFSGGLLRLTDIAFSDRGELLGLARVEAKGLSFDLATRTTRLDAFEVSGPAISASRDAEGVVHVLGVRSRTGSAPRKKAVSPATLPEPAAGDAPRDESAAPAPRSPRGDIQIGRLAWKDVKLRFQDAAVSPPADVAIADGGFEIENVVIPGAAAEGPARATLRAWLTAPGLIEKLDVTGSVSARASSPSVEAVVKGKGFSWAALAPYLKPHGIEPAIENGAFESKLRVDATLVPGGIDAALAIEDAALTGAGGESLGLGAFRMEGIRVRESDVRIGTVQVVAPRLDAGREEDGAIVVAGLRYRAVPPPGEDVAPEGEPAPAPVAAAPPVTTPAPPPAPETQPTPTGPTPAVTLERFLLHDAAITLWDRAVAPPIRTRTTAGAELRGLVIGRAADPAWFSASLASEGILDRLAVVGAVSLAPEAKTFQMNVEGNGLRAGPLAAYFPPSTRMSLADGRVRGKLSARLETHPEGGHRGAFTITEAAFQDGPDGPALLALGSAKLDIARADVVGRRIDIEEVSASGVELAVRREPAGGGITVLGVTVSASPGSPTSESAVSTKPSPEPGAAPDAQPRTAAAMPSRLHAKPPLVFLGKLDLALDRLTITDAGDSRAAPITLEARLASKKRIELLGDEPEERPPFELDLTGKLTPLIGAFGAAARISPYAAEPSLEVDFQASGIRGEGLLEAFPSLSEKIDGRELADGRVRGRVEATFQVKRRYPADVGFSVPFGMRFHVKGAEFRGGPEGPVLLGLQELAMEAPRIDPKTGGVHVKSVEITKPAALVRRTREGVHAAGFLVRLPPAAEGTETAAGSDEQPEAAPPPEPKDSPPPASPAPGTPTAEVRIDRLIVTGVDFLLEDTSAEPAFRMPLTDLDVEVHGITNRVLAEPRPIRFSALLRSGKVPLLKTLKKGADPGAGSDAIAPASGDEVEKEGGFEERTLFEEATTSGKITLYPKPSGWVKAGLSSFELAAVRGIAASRGVTLKGGLFDAGASVRLASEGSLDADTSLTFTDLDLDEPADGPIKQNLGLTVPLSTVIFVLRDEDGALEIPVSFEVEAEGLSKAEIVRAALASLGAMIGNALASAPLRVAGSVGSLVGVEEEEKKAEDPVILRFGGGDPSASGSEVSRLEPLLERLRDGEELNLTLTHALGGADVARAGLRSSPSVTEVMDLARQLQFRRDELVRERASRAAEARAYYGLGLGREAAAAAERAAKLDREAGLLELSLDRLRDLIRPGAERQGVRRMREASLAIGRARLAGIRWALIDSGIEGIEERIRIMPARFEEPQGDAGGTVSVLASVRKEP